MKTVKEDLLKDLAAGKWGDEIEESLDASLEEFKKKK
jgi:hypothetical protein